MPRLQQEVSYNEQDLVWALDLKDIVGKLVKHQTVSLVTLLSAEPKQSRQVVKKTLGMLKNHLRHPRDL